ncbi:hypothetical protein [Variovorax arabinosiphilus]|uniref:hypothetical protein n=1 Tax=Variovorax arabinosiphilus TaxID=3053498 RepID=UPI002575409C|nr:MULTISPECIES: hypothetical protein [unclassified Variovorax]MDM0119841.1 hypothetical protein [Variovorax sp. J2L1-78]MDM0128247.1 hypothetical protein [Variovorax sp. J2L1-63]MDM0231947.1 hypothetical protein [Variovorax sp. J2R1-6]
MRRSAVWLSCVMGLAPLGAGAAAPTSDPWSGVYRLEWVKGGATAERSGAASQTLVVAKAADADPAKLVERDWAELSRWTLREATGSEQGRLLRRFVERDYEGLGWSALHAAGSIECLDGGHLFFCLTQPGTTVALGPEGPKRETLIAQTGVFGIVLHAGAFELKKLD